MGTNNNLINNNILLKPSLTSEGFYNPFEDFQ